MRVLVACEESQAVAIEFRKLGHEAYSCDIEPCSGGHPEWHIQQDVLPLINGYCKFKTVDGIEHEIGSKWDMLIAFQPCTYLSNAGAKHLFRGGQLNQDRYQKGLKAKEFFLAFLNADCSKDDPNFEYAKATIDRELKRICGEKFEPWEVRYKV